MSLRSWLRSHEVFDTDIEFILDDFGITNPESDFKKISEKQWTEIRRIIVVERQNELKDSNTIQRLHSKLDKIEQYWRKQSGIKPRHRKSLSNGSITYDTPLKPNKTVDNALNNATELKQWLRKNEVWSKDLFLTLVNDYKIYTVKDLRTNIDSEAVFTEIVRKVKLARAEDTKSSAVMDSMNALLYKFENLWRRLSGIPRKGDSSNRNILLKRRSSSVSSTSSLTLSENEEKSGCYSAPKNAKEAKMNENMHSKATSLKRWMVSNSVWEKELFAQLCNRGITEPQQINQLKASDLAAIKRIVTVERFKNANQMGARARCEKLLSAFEKLWKKALQS